MTMLTGRLRKRILDCKLPDKVILQAIDLAERGGLAPLPYVVGSQGPEVFAPESAQDAQSDSPPVPESQTPAGPETPAPRRRRGYSRRDMRAE